MPHHVAPAADLPAESVAHVVLRSAASLRPQDAKTATSGLERLTAESLLDLLDLLRGPSGGSGLGPGDLLSVVLAAAGTGASTAALAAVDRLLARDDESQHGPERLNGTSELARADNAVFAALHDVMIPAEEMDLALLERFELTLPGLSCPVPCRQLTMYFRPAQQKGFRLHCLPPVTLLVAVVSAAEDAAVLRDCLSVLHRGRGRVFRDEYHEQKSASGYPALWPDDVLRHAVDLVVDAGTIVPEAGRQVPVGQLFEATVAAKARLTAQELELEQRAAGARWKLAVHEDDLRVLRDAKSVDVGAARALLAPCRHYVQQLEECRSRVSGLNARCSELFTVISAMADRALLEKTDGARQAAVVIGVLTALLATVGLFAALAAIPLQESRTLRPDLRVAAIVGALVTGAALVGLLLARASSRRQVTAAPPVIEALAVLPPAERSQRRLDLPLGVLATALFSWGAVQPSLGSVVAGVVAGTSAVAVHVRRSTF